MRAVKTIAAREFMQVLRTPAFLLTTVLGLFCLVGLSFIPTLVNYMEKKNHTNIVVVDTVGGMLPLMQQSLQAIPANMRPDITFNPVANGEQPNEATLRQLVEKGQLSNYLLVTPNPAGLNEPVFSLGTKYPSSTLTRSVEQVLRPVAISRRLLDLKISPQQAAKMAAPVLKATSFDRRYANRNQFFTSQTLAYLLLFMLYMTLIGYGSVLTHGVAAEKGSRVMEMMLVSVRPTDLLTGKMLGLGAASLLQYLLWVGAGLAVSWARGAFSNLTVGGVQLQLAAVPVSTILYFLLYYVLGYLAYSALYAAAGCLVNRPEESSQTVMPVVLLMVAAYIIAFSALNNPGGTVARVSSLVPFLTPMVMFTRIVMSSVPITEILLSVVFLVLFIWLAIVLGGRIYRHSVLRTRRASWLEGLRG